MIWFGLVRYGTQWMALSGGLFHSFDSLFISIIFYLLLLYTFTLLYLLGFLSSVGGRFTYTILFIILIATSLPVSKGYLPEALSSFKSDTWSAVLYLRHLILCFDAWRDWSYVHGQDTGVGWR